MLPVCRAQKPAQDEIFSSQVSVPEKQEKPDHGRDLWSAGIEGYRVLLAPYKLNMDIRSHEHLERDEPGD